MKKILASTILTAAVLFNLPAIAGMKNQTNSMSQASTQNMQSSQPQIDLMTIEQVQTLGDDTPVMLEGMIVQSMGDEMYTFQDAAGNTIMVEINNESWNGLKPNPNDMVIITGETDKKGNIVEIDVDTIALKQQSN